MNALMHHCAAALLSLMSCAQAASFEFVAIGDMPYGKREQVAPIYQHLIDQINEVAPAFTLHVGDFKTGGSPCTDEEFERQREFFGQFKTALVYTPGDNEWTDCHRAQAGGFAPQERLARLRALFFARPQSQGAAPIPVEQQPGQPENQRFERDGVLFVMLHVVGSNNGFEPRDLAAAQEFFVRERANLEWLDSSFALAQQRARAVVIAIQADPLGAATALSEFPSHGGFTQLFERKLLPLVQDFARPVLLIHGDSHRFTLDRPFKQARGAHKGQLLSNLLRLQVFGEQEMHAVRVRVNTQAEQPFSFTPLFNPRSLR